MSKLSTLKVFGIIGLMAVLYFLGKLCHLVVLFREDSGRPDSFLDTLLFYAFVFLCIFSLPVALAFGLIHNYQSQRLFSIHEKELLEAKLNFSRLCSRCREMGYYDPELAKEPESWEPLD